MKAFSSVRPSGFWINAGLAVLAAYFFVSWLAPTKLAIWPMQETDLRANVEGKDFLIVGGTKGIGHALMESLAKRGARVTITGRSSPEHLPKQVSVVRSDVSTLKAAQDLVGDSLKGRRFDTVVFTVGIFSSPHLKRNSEGVEEDLATSYMSRFVIANELLKTNALVGRKRMFIMGYPGAGTTPTNLDDINFEHTDYSVLGAHFNTVVFNEALVYELARRHKDVHVFGLNPGMIATGIRDNLHGGSKSLIGRLVEFCIAFTMPSPDQYVERVVLPLVASPQLDKKTGVCFTKYGSVAPMHSWMADSKNRLQVWEASEKLMAKVLLSSAQKEEHVDPSSAPNAEEQMSSSHEDEEHLSSAHNEEDRALSSAQDESHAEVLSDDDEASSHDEEGEQVSSDEEGEQVPSDGDYEEEPSHDEEEEQQASSPDEEQV